MEAGQDVVGPGQGEHLKHLGGGNLVNVDATGSVEGGDPSVLLEAVGVGCQFDESDRHEPGGQTGFGLEPTVEVSGVFPHLGRGLGQ